MKHKVRHIHFVEVGCAQVWRLGVGAARPVCAHQYRVRAGLSV